MSGLDRVAALAGRRIDAPDAAQPRFPLSRMPEVRQALAELLHGKKVVALVSSAACGADLLALDVAMQAGIRFRVVLPFGRARFRRTSVIDRPGEWGPLFDRVIAAADAGGQLIELAHDGEENQAYLLATDAILAEAQKLAQGARAMAIVVWEGSPRGADDATEAFRQRSRSAGMEEFQILTR
jgi:hypothetical protein